MAFVWVGRLDGAPPLEPDREIDTSPVVVRVLNDGDKSDPLNKLLVIGFRVGDRFGGRVTVPKDGQPETMERAIAALLLAVADHAAEFRDAVAEERANAVKP